MESTTLVCVGVGAVVGGLITRKKKGGFLKGALWGGTGAALGVIAAQATRGSEHEHHVVGQLPQALPTPGLPGQVVYNLDPRRDPLLDPVSRQQLYPTWLLMHWQHGDPKVIADVQRLLGVPADGVIGGGTSNAIRAYQAQNGLPVTGIMDHMTLAALVSS
jgi:peptidoglycan hydrolase-like protein with peptidoglycan-binding domain